MSLKSSGTSIQAAGTTSEIDNTRLWSWANDSIPSNASAAMLDVRAYSQSGNLKEVLNASSPCDEYFGWAITAIAAKIFGAVGAYRCPNEGGLLYLVSTDISFTLLSHAERDSLNIACDKHGEGYETFVCEHFAPCRRCLRPFQIPIEVPILTSVTGALPESHGTISTEIAHATSHNLFAFGDFARHLYSTTTWRAPDGAPGID